MEMILESDVIRTLTAFANAGANSGWIEKKIIIAALNMIKQRDTANEQLRALMQSGAALAAYAEDESNFDLPMTSPYWHVRDVIKKLRDRIAELEATVGAIEAGLRVEFRGGNTDDLIDDFTTFLEHHKQREAEIKKLNDLCMALSEQAEKDVAAAKIEGMKQLADRLGYHGGCHQCGMKDGESTY